MEVASDKHSLGSMKGFVKIWKVNKTTGKSQLVVDKPNTILYGGAQILSYALAGNAAAPIWGMYIGYNNNVSFVYPTVDLAYSASFLNFTTPFGCLREPLSHTPSYLTSPSYTNNTPIFTVDISSASSSVAGAPFTPGVSNIYEIALLSAFNPTLSTGDIVFSRTQFNQITYDSNFNLTISWGVQFLATAS
jgi:hypothetical protein